MPLSTVCVSALTGGRPKAWSSHNNLENKDENVSYNLRTMNSTEELNRKKIIRKPGYFEYDFSDEKPATVKKDGRKWSFTNLFRRNKKKIEFNSSAEDDKKKRNNSNLKKKKSGSSITFDHVISTQNSQNFGSISNSKYPNISRNTSNVEQKCLHSFEDIPAKSDDYFSSQRSNPNQLSLDSVSRKKLAKFRAEARRTSSFNSSSSDEDSTSSKLRQSDDSLQAYYKKKSRSARTERYLKHKRYSKDGENPYLRISKSDDNKSPSISPLFSSSMVNSTISTVSTIPTFPTSQRILHEYNAADANELPINYVQNNQNRSVSFDDMPLLPSSISNVQLGGRNFNNSSSSLRQNYGVNCYNNSSAAITPPIPPPRDLTRKFQFKSTSEDYLRPTNVKETEENYQYLTDKHPRSRKPIFIQKQLLKEEVQPQIFKCETKVENKIFRQPQPNDVLEKNPSSLLERNPSSVSERIPTSSVVEMRPRKSANLEEALNELEEIYNSLKLGDENLLELAEKRENEELEKYRSTNTNFSSAGAMSDSSFNYEPFDASKNRRRKSKFRKNLENDDMAYRKIRTRDERAATIDNPQNISSYLLTNPIYSNLNQSFHKNYDFNQDFRVKNRNFREPDIISDDVLYRSIKQSNQQLKVPEHPPPFGIPLGPIAPSSNSDYLHAIPINPAAILNSENLNNNNSNARIPDLVKDDLAYRNLRKDGSKELPVLPPISSNSNSVEDVRNNNFNNWSYNISDSPRLNFAELKKRRATRSKSANIGSLISQEVIERASRRNGRDKSENSMTTLGEIADVMELARNVLKEKELKNSEFKRASFSDTEMKYSRFSPNSNPSHIGLKVEKAVKEETIFEDKTPVDVDEFISSIDCEGVFKSSSFENALTALAIEAKEASDQFTKQIEEESNRNDVKCSENDAEKSENEAKSGRLEAGSSKNEPLEEPDYENCGGKPPEPIHDNLKSSDEDEESCSLGEEKVKLDVVQPKFDQIDSQLKSPKLVLEMAKLSDRTRSNLGHSSDSSSSNSNSLKTFSAWHNNPSAAFFVACSLACFHDLISLDFFAFFSIIFAILTLVTSHLF